MQAFVWLEWAIISTLPAVLSQRAVTTITREQNQARTSASTRAGFTLVSFCSSPWKE